ncbi:MAG: metallophosphoesterase, partial [bacterium]|nr:metallophosphoesterase [bacterium]
MASSLRIGHISDLHLRQHLAGTSAVAARCSRDMPALFTEALAAMRAAAVSVVVVTGDLIDHPHEPQDTPGILRDGAQDLRLVGQALAGLTCPWVVLPGNHDHAELFQREFGAQSRELNVQGVRLLAFHDWDRPLLTPAAEEERIPQNVPRRVGAERRRFEAILA